MRNHLNGSFLRYSWLALACAIAVSCSGGKPSENSSVASSSRSVVARKVTFAMVPKGVHPYFLPVYKGFSDAGQKYAVLTELDAPPRFDVSLQVKLIEDLIARGVDGIAISANDDAGLVSVIHEAVQSGIKVITVDGPAPSSEALTYIGTDNESSGFESGRRMARTMGGAGSLAILQGGQGATNLNLRTKGFKKGLAEAGPAIEVVGVIDEGGDLSQSVSAVETLLAERPRLNAIFCVSAEGAPAVAAVVKRQGKAGKILIAGFDDLRDTIEGIRDGSIAFCVVQNTYRMGWLSVERLLDAAAGRSIPREIDTGVVFVDRGNVDSYKAAMEVENAREGIAQKGH
jgi:ribose transport system substrate-binding protein